MSSDNLVPGVTDADQEATPGDGAEAVAQQLAALETLALGDEDLEELEGRVGRFNLFDAIGAVSRELRHSQTIGFLCDPNQPHGLDDLFLRRLMIRATIEAKERTGWTLPIGAVDIEVAAFGDAEVRREWRNIDILIIAHEARLVFAIENKVFSGEHSDQLTKYQRVLDEHFPANTWRRSQFFLTPEGVAPSLEDTWCPISYRSVVAAVSDIERMRQTTLGTDVQVFLRHYREAIEGFMMPDQRVLELARKLYQNHRIAFDLILEARPDQQSDIAEVVDEVMSGAGFRNVSLRAKGDMFFIYPAFRSCRKLVGPGMDYEGNLIYVDVSNKSDSLAIFLYLGRAKDEFIGLREEVSEEAQKLIGRSKFRLSPKYTTLKRWNILSKKQLEEPVELEEVREKLTKEVTNGLLPALEKIRQSGKFD